MLLKGEALYEDEKLARQERRAAKKAGKYGISAGGFGLQDSPFTYAGFYDRPDFMNT